MKKYGLAIADVSKWHLAWDRYSLGAAMVQQMSFRCAQRHKAIVVEVHMYLHLCSACVTLLSAVWQVSCLAQTEGLNEVLGVIYDDYWRRASVCDLCGRTYFAFACVQASHGGLVSEVR